MGDFDASYGGWESKVSHTRTKGILTRLVRAKCGAGAQSLGRAYRVGWALKISKQGPAMVFGRRAAGVCISKPTRAVDP